MTIIESNLSIAEFGGRRGVRLVEEDFPTNPPPGSPGAPRPGTFGPRLGGAVTRNAGARGANTRGAPPGARRR